MYYCMKFGVKSHIDSCGSKETPEEYAVGLNGRINYVLSVEPQNRQMQKYKKLLKEQFKTQI